MEQYDVVAVGGGFAGSLAARYAAEHGFRTLLVERARTPREKPCSGIQFTYLEKLVGAPIPRNVLCRNELFKVEMVAPSGRTTAGKMKMLNFWRSTFDRWLNDLAAAAGALFQDHTRLVDFHPEEDGFILELQSGEALRSVRTRYLVAADGMSSRVRRKLRPDDFTSGTPGGSMNYYCRGEGALDPNTLYMINNREFAPLMFAWVYLKDDQWVIGTGADEDPVAYADRFFEYVKARYGFEGEILRREGFASPLMGGVFLGLGNLLLAGDAAGLIDMHRGLGMDNAALSGRYAAQAIAEAERSGRPALACYERLLGRMLRQLAANERKRQARFSSNEELERSMAPAELLKGGLGMMGADLLNRFLPAGRIITLPL